MRVRVRAEDGKFIYFLMLSFSFLTPHSSATADPLLATLRAQSYAYNLPWALDGNLQSRLESMNTRELKAVRQNWERMGEERCCACRCHSLALLPSTGSQVSATAAVRLQGVAGPAHTRR